MKGYENPMKKFVSLLLVMGIIFSMTACGRKADSSGTDYEPEEMEFSEIQWPETDIAKLMPIPKSLMGNIYWSHDYGFVIYIAEISAEDYAAYVKECEDLGFTLECRKGDDYFYADNTDGYHVAIRHEEDNVMFIRIDEPKEEQTDPVTEPAVEQTPELENPLETPDTSSEVPSETQTNPPVETMLLEDPKIEEAVYYSTNTFDQAKKGNSGIFSYKRNGPNYDFYWIIDFDEGCAYYFTYGNSATCERVQIDEGDGDLNSYITVTYHDGDSTWQYGFCFKRVRQPDRLIQSELDGTQYEFVATSLNDALKLRDELEIVDY